MVPITEARDGEDVVAPAVATHLVSSAFARHRTLFCWGRAATIAVRVAAEALVPVLQAEVLEATSRTERSTHLLRCVCTHVNDVALQVPVLIIDEASLLYERHCRVDHQVGLLMVRHVVHLVAPHAAAHLGLTDTSCSSSGVARPCPSPRAVRIRCHQRAELVCKRGRCARCVAAARHRGVLAVAPSGLVVTVALVLVLDGEMLVALADLGAGPDRGCSTHVGDDTLALHVH